MFISSKLYHRVKFGLKVFMLLVLVSSNFVNLSLAGASGSLTEDWQQPAGLVEGTVNKYWSSQPSFSCNSDLKAIYDGQVETGCTLDAVDVWQGGGQKLHADFPGSYVGVVFNQVENIAGLRFWNSQQAAHFTSYKVYGLAPQSVATEVTNWSLIRKGVSSSGLNQVTFHKAFNLSGVRIVYDRISWNNEYSPDFLELDFLVEPVVTEVPFDLAEQLIGSEANFNSTFKNVAALESAEEYQAWKTKFVSSQGAGLNGLRVRNFDPVTCRWRAKGWYYPYCTISESIGYGLILAASHQDRVLFDGLWNYYQNHLNENGLMGWFVSAEGEVLTETDSNGRTVSVAATDADQDVAFALVLAAKQWQSEDYLEAAQKLSAKIYDYEINHSNYLVKPGDSHWWQNPGHNGIYNPSYFAPAYYRLFAKISAGTNYQRNWLAVVQAGYAWLAKVQAVNNTVLWPDWADQNGQTVNNIWGHFGGDFAYEAVRVSWRLALDQVLFPNDQAKQGVAGVVQFVENQGGASNLKTRYSLQGKAKVGYSAAVTTGPLMVACLSSDAKLSSCVDLYNQTATLKPHYRDLYGRFWRLISLSTVSGQLLDSLR